MTTLFSFEIITETHTDAASDRCWKVLTDFGSYPEWNPVIRKASGEPVVGSRLKLLFWPAGRKARTFRPKLTVARPGRELRWLGSPGVRGILSSEHFFILESAGSSEIRIVHGMMFRGLLAPLLARRLEAEIRAPFEEMNLALKERAESRLSL